MLTYPLSSTQAAWYHLLSSVTSSKNKIPFWTMCWLDLLYKYVGEYVVSLVSFTKFNYMSKKKKNHFPPNKWSILCTQEILHKYKSMPKTKKKKISRQKMPKPNQSANWDFRFNRSPSQKKKKLLFPTNMCHTKNSNSCMTHGGNCWN